MATDSSVNELVQRTEQSSLAKQQQFEFASIEDAVRDLEAGRMIVVIDDEDRENEGDLTMGGGHDYAGGHQLHGHSWKRLDLPRHDWGAPRRLGTYPDGAEQQCVRRHSLHRFNRCEKRRSGQPAFRHTIECRRSGPPSKQPVVLKILRDRGMSFHFAPALAVYWNAEATRRRRSILQDSQDYTRPA